jgi:hypothetical protein
MGYSVGGATGEGATTRAAAPPPPTAAPALLRLDRVYADGRAYGYRLAEDRAYVHGRKDGLAEGRRAARRERMRTGLQVRLGALRAGRSYRLCRSGTALCELPAKPAPGR